MKKFKKLLSDIWNDESGQGAVEYILLIVVVVAAVLAFKDPLLSAIDNKVSEFTDGMGRVGIDR